MEGGYGNEGWVQSCFANLLDVYKNEQLCKGTPTNICTPLYPNQSPQQTFGYNVIGDFNAYNILAVYSIANILKINKDLILEKLSQLNSPNGRFEFLIGGNNQIGIVDYAHTPDGLRCALMALKHHFQGKIWCVFGCGSVLVGVCVCVRVRVRVRVRACVRA